MKQQVIVEISPTETGNFSCQIIFDPPLQGHDEFMKLSENEKMMQQAANRLGADIFNLLARANETTH